MKSGGLAAVDEVRRRDLRLGLFLLGHFSVYGLACIVDYLARDKKMAFVK